jgi:WG containing repeat
LRNEKTKKYGLINAKGETIVPFVHDSLITVNEKKQLFISIQKNKYQFLNSANKARRPIYDYLAQVDISRRFKHQSNSVFSVFVAKKEGKWGIVDTNDQILKPFVADYAAHWNDKMVLVENTTAHYFNEATFPNEDDCEELLGNNENVFACELANSVQTVFFINRKGQVAIPPQYKTLEKLEYRFMGNQEDYIAVEDAQKKRKLVSTETGAVIDFPFDYHVEITNSQSKLVVVSDDKITIEEGHLGKKWGAVTTDGRQLTPCTNAGIVIADAKFGTYFVRQDTPKTPFHPYISYDELDTLGIADNDWLWYNVEGKLLDATAFRYPIAFYEGLGIGMKGELFGLYQVDGGVLAPPQYKNIRRDEKTGFYYLFENQGMKMTVCLKKSDGKTFLKAGRYDAISPFFGKYALARSSGKVGLVDTFGNEIVVPQDLLTFNSVNLFDSLCLYDKQQRLNKLSRYYSEEYYGFYSRNRRLPISFLKSRYEPDSLTISPSLRNTIWHLMLEKIQDDVFWQSLDFNFDRSRQHVGIYYNIVQSCSSGRLSDEDKRSYTGNRVIVSDSLAAFSLNKGYRASFFFNFYYKNNHWNEVTINDVLMIQGEKRSSMTC